MSYLSGSLLDPPLLVFNVDLMYVQQ